MCGTCLLVYLCRGRSGEACVCVCASMVVWWVVVMGGLIKIHVYMDGCLHIWELAMDGYEWRCLVCTWIHGCARELCSK